MEWVIVVLVLLGVAVIWLYNRLVRLRNTVAEAWAGIDVQLQRRHELIPNLVATVRGYLRHEAEVLESVTLQRSALPDHVAELSGQETRLSRSIGHLFALAEDYPELRASENLQQLHDGLVEVEEQLQYARRYFNGAVRDLNNAVESFPSNLLARSFGFRAAEFFEIEFASQRQAPRVNLDSGTASGA